MSRVKLIMVLITTLVLSIPSLGLTEETKGEDREVINLFKVKLAYDIDADTDVKFTLAYWEQDRDSNDPETYLTDSAGNKVYSGAVDTDRGSMTINEE